MKHSPSFSSTVLDEIYRSIDGEEGTTPVAKAQVEQKKTKQTKSDTEYVLKLRRTCLVDEWMELERKATQPPQSLDDDSLGFCFSSLSSSDSSFSDFSSCDCDSVYRIKQRDSCFPPINRKPKPVPTALASPKSDSRALFLERLKLDDYCTTVSADDDKTGLGSKSKALRMYADLKKAKLPISPGGKLTSFINSMFTGRSDTKAADASPNAVMNDFKSPNSRLSSTCSSASSFTRSCLVKKSPSSRGQAQNEVKKKSVRFYPPSIEHSIEIRSRNVEHSQRSTSWRKDKNLKFSSVEINKGGHEFPGEGDDIDDAASDTSSELFEIDHLVFAGINNNGGIHHEELPVFETTSISRTNRAIRNGKIM